MPPTTSRLQEKKPAVSSLQNQALEKQLTSVKKLYAQLLTQVRDESPERFETALQEKLEEIAEDHKQGHPFERNFHEVLLRFAKKATEVRYKQLDDGHKCYIQDLDNEHRARTKELEELHEKTTREQIAEWKVSNTAQLKARLQELNDKRKENVEREVQKRVDLAFGKQYKEDIQKAADQIEARVTAKCHHDFDVQHAKNLAEIDGRVQVCVEHIQAGIEASAQEKISHLEAGCAAEVERRVQARFAQIQGEVEGKCAADAEARLVEIRASIEASAQENINAIQTKCNGEVESRVEARLLEITATLEASSQSKINDIEARVEGEVDDRVSKIRASVEARAQKQIAEAKTKSAEDQASLQARTTTMADELEGLRERLEAVSRERNEALSARDSAIKDFDALQDQITKQDEALEAEKVKSKKAEGDLLAKEKERNGQEIYIAEIEADLAKANDDLEAAQVSLDGANQRANQAVLAKDQAEERLHTAQTDTSTQKIVKTLETERLRLESEVKTLNEAAQRDQTELERIPILESEIQKTKKLYAQMVEQLTLLRQDMEKNKFDPAPDAYDDPSGPGAFTSMRNDFGSQQGSENGSERGSHHGTEVGSQYSASAAGSDAGSDCDSSDDDSDESAASFVPSAVNYQPPVFIPATTSSHNPLMCWLSTERHALVMGGAVITKSTNFMRQSWSAANKGTGSTPSSPTGSAQISPKAPAYPSSGGSGSTPPMSSGEPGAQDSPSASPKTSIDGVQTSPDSPATDSEGLSKNNQTTLAPRSNVSGPLEPSAVMARSLASSISPKFMSSEPSIAALEISTQVSGHSCDKEGSEATHRIVPLESSSPVTSHNLDTIFMNMAITGNGGASSPASPAFGNGSEARKEKTAEEFIAENMDPLSGTDNDGRVPIQRGDLPSGASFSYARQPRKGKGRGRSKDKATHSDEDIDNEDSHSTASKSSKSSNSNSNSNSKRKPRTPSSAFSHSTTSTSLPHPHPSLWDEMRTPHALNTPASYRTLFFLAFHMLVYFTLYLALTTYLLGNVWIAANEQTRAAVQQAVRANRSGQGQTWVHFAFSEGVARWLDWLGWVVMGGGERVAYPMAG